MAIMLLLAFIYTTRYVYDMGVTSRTLQTLEKCPSENKNNIGKLQKLHGVIKGILVHYIHVLYRSNLTI